MVATQDVSMSAVEVMRNREITLQVPSAGFVDRLDLRCERERGIKGDSRAFVLNSWKHRAALS